MKDYSEDIKTCEKHIRILQNQISEAEEGRGFFSVPIKEAIESWKEVIKRHESTITVLRRLQNRDLN